ncbi:hypothetical protein [uncultured Bifidobacterium sp.]|uniref:hypothetical protein n=1 Tax=Bifidobacterium hominis TaxID=3133177 RepID=UPI0011735CA1|nr:hypothetical protein [uncultured Bifidobacterium sp.]VUX31083.1 Uncharacterised protein [Bifidobacterium pseudocatenulatum]
MKKKIVAILAAIATMFGFGFAANTAMAYGATGTVSGNVATFTFTGLTPGETYVVAYDDTNIENVTLAATKYSNAAQAHDDGTLTATYTFKSGFAGTIASSIYAADKAGNPTGAALASASVTVAATGEGTAKKNETASTGAAIAPYVVAVVLLAAAGISLVAVRKSSAR